MSSVVAAGAVLAGCAHTTPPWPQPGAGLQAPAAWQAPVPAPQLTAQTLGRWWSAWNDPLLHELQVQAERLSPGLAAAATRVARARHAAVEAGAAGVPQLQAVAGVSRGVSQLGWAPATLATAGLQASWELDLWGGLQAGQQAAAQRLVASDAQRAAVRVALSAEVARQYAGWRSCLQFQHLAAADARSRETTAGLTARQARVGLAAPAAAALAQASAAQGRMAVVAQQARCDGAARALTELTGVGAADLHARLPAQAGVGGEVPDPARLALPVVPALAFPAGVPAQVLQQRPDVFAAQRQAEAAWADVAQADADLKPRLSLSGQITVVRSLGSSADGSLWSVGPVQISLPLLDGGRRQSLAGVSRVAQDEALSALQATVRTAVREVETALIDLHATAARQTDAAVATEGMAQVLQAAVQRQRAGLASLFELEDARRNALAARLALAELERDRVWAWIALFQALGGGWQANPDALAADLGLATPRN